MARKQGYSYHRSRPAQRAGSPSSGLYGDHAAAFSLVYLSLSPTVGYTLLSKNTAASASHRDRDTVVPEFDDSYAHCRESLDTVSMYVRKTC